MSITGAGTDCVQILGVATLTMGHVACTDHMVWLAEAYRARYAAQPHSLCGSVSLVAINFNANLRKIHPGTSTQLNSAHFDLHIRASAFQFSWRSVYRISIYELRKAQKCTILHAFLAWNQNGTLITGADTDCVHVMHVGTPSMGHAAWFVGRA